jgi:hypothetical protein
MALEVYSRTCYPDPTPRNQNGLLFTPTSALLHGAWLLFVLLCESNCFSNQIVIARRFECHPLIMGGIASKACAHIHSVTQTAQKTPAALPAVSSVAHS